MRDPGRNVLALALTDAGSFFAHSRFLSRPGADPAEPVTRSRTDPRSTFGRARRRQPACAVGIACAPGWLLLLAGNRLGRAFAGAGIGMSALTTNGQAAALPQPPRAAAPHNS